MSKLNYSQTTYPKRVVIEGDTCALITIKQVAEINIAYSKLEAGERLVTSLSQQVSLFKRISTMKDSRIKNLQTQIAAKDTVINGYEAEILIRNKMQVKADQKNNWLKWERNILFLGVIFLGGNAIIK